MSKKFFEGIMAGLREVSAYLDGALQKPVRVTEFFGDPSGQIICKLVVYSKGLKAKHKTKAKGKSK
jgi:hypothetical protein